MKKIKIFALLISIFLLCGCTSKMVVEIDSTTIIENLSFEGENQNPNYDEAEAKGEAEYMKYLFNEYYNYNNNENEKEYNKYFRISDYSENNQITQESILTHCFKYTRFYKDDEYNEYTIELDQFICDDEIEKVDKIDLIIKTNGRIITSNSDLENEQIWTFTKDNYSKNVYLIINFEAEQEDDEEVLDIENDPENDLEQVEKMKKEEEEKKEKQKEEDKKQLILLASIVGGFILVLIVAFFVSVFKASKNR